MDKQIALTVLSGFAWKDKNELLRMLPSTNRKKVLFHDPSIIFVKNEEEPLPMTSVIGEAVHDGEMTLSNLHTFLQIGDTSEKSEIILDIFPFTNIVPLVEFLLAQPRQAATAHYHLIDAETFWETYFSEHEVTRTCTETEECKSETLGEIMMKGLELADTVVVTNTDSLSFERLGELTAFLHALVPTATLVWEEEFTWNRARKTSILDQATELYDVQRTLFTSRKDIPVIGQYGIETFVYQSKSLLDYAMLEAFISTIPSEVFRMKGKCYDLTEKEVHVISQVGASVQVETFELEFLPTDGTLTEFLFIGAEMDCDELKRRLDGCFKLPESRYFG